MECDYDDPASVVLCFIRAMHDWESESHRLRRAAKGTADPSSYKGAVLDLMNDVFRQFCTPKPRPYGRNGSFQNPPEYDPESESIVNSDVHGLTASVVTCRNAIIGGGHYHYDLKRRGDCWLIDTLKFREDNGTESRAIL